MVLSSAALPVPLSTPALWLTGVERWLMLAGLSVALGGLAGRGLARQYKGTAPAPLPPPWALRGSLLGLLASAALLVTAVAGPSLAAELARPPAFGLGPQTTARAAGAELVCCAAAALLLRLRQPGWSVLPLLGVVVAEGLRAHPEGMIPAAGAALTWCHLLPAALWAGMLLYTLRAAAAWRADPAAMRGLIRQYGNAAGWLFAVVVVTGVVSAVLLVPLRSLLTTAYGEILVAKAALVAVTAILAIAGRVWLNRHPAPGGGPPLATRLECAALAAVLAVAGLLTVISPSAKPIYPSAGTPRHSLTIPRRLSAQIAPSVTAIAAYPFDRGRVTPGMAADVGGVHRAVTHLSDQKFVRDIIGCLPSPFPLPVHNSVARTIAWRQAHPVRRH
jgi:copper transport protein